MGSNNITHTRRYRWYATYINASGVVSTETATEAAVCCTGAWSYYALYNYAKSNETTKPEIRITNTVNTSIVNYSIKDLKV